jgi:hypothetical protein
MFRFLRRKPAPVTDSLVEAPERELHVEYVGRYNGEVCYGGDGWYYAVLNDNTVDRTHPLIFRTGESGGHWEYAEPHHVDHRTYFETKYPEGREKVLEPQGPLHV